MSRRRAPLRKVVIVNPADEGGGAERQRVEAACLEIVEDEGTTLIVQPRATVDLADAIARLLASLSLRRTRYRRRSKQAHLDRRMRSASCISGAPRSTRFGRRTRTCAALSAPASHLAKKLRMLF